MRAIITNSHFITSRPIVPVASGHQFLGLGSSSMYYMLRQVRHEDVAPVLRGTLLVGGGAQFAVGLACIYYGYMANSVTLTALGALLSTAGTVVASTRRRFF